MNIIWTFIIIFCLIFSFFTNNFSNLINSLFDVPEYSLKTLISIGSLIIIYNGIFQIADDCNLIKKISSLFRPIIKIIYKINSEDLVNLLCANFTANLLGLSITSTSIAIKIVKETNDKKIINKLICLNTSCFTILPFTIISLRNKYGGINNFKVWLLIIIITFLTSIFSIIICSVGDRK